MSGIVFVPKHNTGSKSDATHAFHPEARRLVERRGGRIVVVDNKLSPGAMRERVVLVLRDALECDSCDESHAHRLGWVAFACHGYAKGIQLGFDLTTVEQLAAAMASVCEEDVVVPLYACSTASTTARLLRLGSGPGGDGGFADELRDALCRAGLTRCTVDAHITAGHASKNPRVRRFSGDGSRVGGVGGMELFPMGKRGSAQRRTFAEWQRGLADDDDPLRFDFPWMTAGELHDEVARRLGAA